ncbi:putative reverse transcriptase domain-containing protein [Tanacetum coccineum]|uniref:Reverse transcriptase domain-containing protein n=1 Tax=Tanacetum coccineum TaxID=301880 RepID=A0ABQ5G0W3_9ASTR
MAPKRATRSNIAPAATAATTTTVTNAQLQAMIDQGITAVLAARDANTNGVDSHNSGTDARRNERATHNCTYPDFMKTVGNDIAYAMTWVKLNKMTNKYCPRTEIKKLEVKLCELKVKGTDVIGYNQHFQELALLCSKMFPKESDKIEKYVGGLPDMIHESIVASKPKTMQVATEMATEVMDKRIRTFADRTGKKKPYGGSKPLCTKCNYHHDGLCAPKCHKCNRVGHLAHDCRSLANTNASNNRRGTEAGQKPTCYECGNQRHYKSDCPELKNRNHENQAEVPCDEPLAVRWMDFTLNDKLQFVEEPVEIMDREVKRLKRSRIPLVKVRWNSRRGPEFTWEREDQFRKKYPHLFTKTAPSSSATS